MASEELNQEHIVRSFDEELNLLTSTLVRMGGVTEAQLNSSIRAVEMLDLDLAESVIQKDKELDAFEMEIEALVTRLFALRQPMAVDLRAVMAALRISADLERIGDYSKNIASRCGALAEMDSLPNVEGIIRMGMLAGQCLKKVLNGYQSQDYEIALESWKQDEEIDRLYSSVFMDLVQFMREDPSGVSAGTQLAFVGKNLERIGDLTTNIAEEIYLMVRGERISMSRPKADTTASVT